MHCGLGGWTSGLAEFCRAMLRRICMAQSAAQEDPRNCGPGWAVQSACSVDRVDAALATLLPLVPGITYFRFCCEDVRCGIELDEIDPEQWALLEVSHLLTHHPVTVPPSS